MKKRNEVTKTDAQCTIHSVMRCFSVQIRGCDDSTHFEMQMTDQEYEFLQKVCKLSAETSTYECMPTMVGEPK